MNNALDKIRIDVDFLYKSFPFRIITNNSDVHEGKIPHIRSKFPKIYKTSIVPLFLRRFLWKIFRQINFDISWLIVFNQYWTIALRGRPLWSVHDFFFLKNIYRLQFQEVNIADSCNEHEHLRVWQKPEILYQLLHLVAKESLYDEIELLKIVYKYKPNARSILEFGSGTAPIATTWRQFSYPKNKCKWIISDIKTVSFHYACFKFRDDCDVIAHLLLPENHFLPDPDLIVDVIFCITVLEHLQNPLNVIKRLYTILAADGVLIFDFIKSTGHGMDTMNAVNERSNVIKYLREKFDVIEGTLEKSEENSVGLIVVRKK